MNANLNLLMPDILYSFAHLMPRQSRMTGKDLCKLISEQYDLANPKTRFQHQILKEANPYLERSGDSISWH